MTERAKSTSTEQARGSVTEQAKGSVKEAIGKLTGDVRIEAEGKAQKRRTRPAKAGTPQD